MSLSFWLDHFLDSRAEIHHIFALVFGRLKTPKSHSEINGPLAKVFCFSDQNSDRILVGLRIVKEFRCHLQNSNQRCQNQPNECPEFWRRQQNSPRIPTGIPIRKSDNYYCRVVANTDQLNSSAFPIEILVEMLEEFRCCLKFTGWNNQFRIYEF